MCLEPLFLKFLGEHWFVRSVGSQNTAFYDEGDGRALCELPS
jgi:hypothetical protein